MMLKNSVGKKSVSFTFAVVAFVATTLWLVLSIVHQLGPVQFRAFDGAAAMAYLGPILALYWGRRHDDQKATPPAETAE
jgi:hypothetical protein